MGSRTVRCAPTCRRGDEAVARPSEGHEAADVISTATLFRRRRAHRHREEQLAHRERQIVQLKSGTYDRVPELLESLHRDLLVRMELYGRVWHDDLAARIGELRRPSEKDSPADGAEAIRGGPDASERRAAA